MPDRRRFLGSLAAAGVASLAVPSAANAEAWSPKASPSASPWDLSWLDQLKGKHRQVFDIGSLEGVSPLHSSKFWLDAHREVYGLSDAQLNAVVGIAGNGFPINFSDALWAKYPLGATWKLTDASTGKPPTRNIFSDPNATGMDAAWTVQALQKRGVIFWMCNNALNIVTGRMAAATNQQPAAVLAEFKAGMLPGVKLVPAHTMLLGLCQEHGCTYQRV